MTAETPLTFIVHGKDGQVLDVIREDDLLTAGTPKAWQEAVLWAQVAWARERREELPA